MPSLLPSTASALLFGQGQAPATPQQLILQVLPFLLVGVAAWTLLGLSAAMMLLALARLLRREDAGPRIVAKHVSDLAILKAADRELHEVERLRHAEGWSEALAVRGLVPLRVAATYALGRPVAQVPTTAGAGPAEGQLVVRSVTRRGMAVALVSGSATADAVRQELDRVRLAGDADMESLSSLHSALAMCSGVAYGRHGVAPVNEPDPAEALASAARAVKAVMREHTRLTILLRAVTRSASAFRSRAWAP